MNRGARADIYKSVLARLAMKGVPPPERHNEILEVFSAGFEEFVARFDKEVLQELLPAGGSTIRFAYGDYGQGKTHLLRLIQLQAHRRGYATAFLELTGKNAFLGAMKSVFQEASAAIRAPVIADGRQGFLAVLDHVARSSGDTSTLADAIRDGASAGKTSWGFAHAAARALELRGTARAGGLVQVRQCLDEYLLGKPRTMASMSHSVRREYSLHVGVRPSHRNAGLFLRSLAIVLQQLGFQGLVLLIDEADPDRRGIGRDAARQLFVLRQLVDDLAGHAVPGFAIVYAALSEFVEQLASYDALRQRIDKPEGFGEHRNLRAPLLSLDQINSFGADRKGHFEAIAEGVVRVAQRSGRRIGSGKREQVAERIEELAGRQGGRVVREFVKSVANICLR